MNLFLPSDKCNGGDRTGRPKSGQRRKRKQLERKEAMEKINRDIQVRKDKALGIRV